MLLPYGPQNQSNKLGFNTFAMWGLCLVVVGVCYKLEQNDKLANPAAKPLPDDVDRVLPSGAFLMKDGSIQNKSVAAPQR